MVSTNPTQDVARTLGDADGAQEVDGQLVVEHRQRVLAQAARHAHACARARDVLVAKYITLHSPVCFAVFVGASQCSTACHMTLKRTGIERNGSCAPYHKSKHLTNGSRGSRSAVARQAFAHHPVGVGSSLAAYQR